MEKQQQNVKKLLRFIQNAEKLKTVIRHSYTSNKTRTESVADHSWMICLMAIILFEYIQQPFDQMKVLKMLIIHDLAEVLVGDIPSHEKSERQNNKKQEESKAMEKILSKLPVQIAKEFMMFFQEFEENKTTEAKIAQAIDKGEALIQHNIADITTWDQGDYNVNPFYRTELYDFDPFLRMFRNEVEKISYKKIKDPKHFSRLNPQHQTLYKKWKKQLSTRG